MATHTQQTTSSPRMPQPQNPTSSVSEYADKLKPVGQFSVRALRGTADYARRHPIRMVISVAALGYVFAKIFQSRSVQEIADELH